MTPEEIARVLEDARNELSRLCHEGHFRMSIPVNEERDSDCILGRALDALAASEQRGKELEDTLTECGVEIASYMAKLQASEQRADAAEASDTIHAEALEASEQRVREFQQYSEKDRAALYEVLKRLARGAPRSEDDV